MSIDQAHAFRTFVNKDASVRQQIQSGHADGSLNLITLASEHGYQLTQAEAQSLAETHENGELELVRGGRAGIPPMVGIDKQSWPPSPLRKWLRTMMRRLSRCCGSMR